MPPVPVPLARGVRVETAHSTPDELSRTAIEKHTSMDMTSTDTTVPTEPSRRRFLRATAATGTLVGVGGLAGAQSRPETIRLGGDIGGWRGRTPDAIAGETNPTLELKTETTYRITWENVDGQPHNVALLDNEGNTLQRTDIISEKGATQTFEFTAREEMAEYLCEVHPTSMRGSVSFGSDTATTTAAEGGEDDSERFIPEGASVRIETLVDGGPTAPLDFAVPPGGILEGNFLLFHFQYLPGQELPVPQIYLIHHSNLLVLVVVNSHYLPERDGFFLTGIYILVLYHFIRVLLHMGQHYFSAY